MTLTIAGASDAWKRNPAFMAEVRS